MKKNNMRPTNNKEILEKILSKTVPHLSGCWFYDGCPEDQGYYRIIYKHNRWYLHRLIFKLYFPDKWKSELFICHRCDNNLCINPEHLFIGTAFDNTQDCINKGRFSQNGSTNADAVFSKEEVLEIKNLCKQGVKQKEVAKKFNVVPATISRIITGISYKDIL